MAIQVGVPKEMEYLLKDRKDIVIDVRIGDYLNTDFLRKYTNFNSYEEFIEFSPYSEDELAADSTLFETEKMNRYIDLTTQFSSYAQLFSFAVEVKLFQYGKEKNGDSYNR